MNRKETKILKLLYSNIKDNKYLDVSIHFIKKADFNKSYIDKCVISLYMLGYVTMQADGPIGNRELPEERKNDINNSYCKITKEGILYYDTYKNNLSTKCIAICALLISFFGFLVSFLDFYLNK